MEESIHIIAGWVSHTWQFNWREAASHVRVVRLGGWNDEQFIIDLEYTFIHNAID